MLERSITTVRWGVSLNNVSSQEIFLKSKCSQTPNFIAQLKLKWLTTQSLIDVYLRDLEQALARNTEGNRSAVLPCKHCNYMNVCDVTLLSNSAGETAASLFIWISVWDQSFLGRANHEAITAAINFCKYTDSAHYTICAAGRRFIAWLLRCSGSHKEMSWFRPLA